MSAEGREVVEYQAPGAPTVHEGRGSLALLSEDEFAHKLQALKTERLRIQKIQRDVMSEGVDYGKVPGTDKPTLLKPGQEALCDMYGYKVRTEKVRTLGDGVTSPTITWDVRAVVHLGTFSGPEVGDGNGSCNSWEVKYRWRRAGLVCPNCGKEAVIKSTDFDTKQPNGWLCWKKKDGCGAKFSLTDQAVTGQTVGKVENEDPWELDNTILKMAEKRAKVDATLSVCAASGLFTQDVGEDDPLEAEFKASDQEQPASGPTAASPAPAPASSGNGTAGSQTPPKVAKELQWQSEPIGRPSKEALTYLRRWLADHGYDESLYRQELGRRGLDGKTLIGVVVQTFPDLSGGAASQEEPPAYEPSDEDVAFFGSREAAIDAHEKQQQEEQPALAG